jgi:hypothetical protein
MELPRDAVHSSAPKPRQWGVSAIDGRAPSDHPAPAGPASASTAVRPRAASGTGPNGHGGRTNPSKFAPPYAALLIPIEDNSAATSCDTDVESQDMLDSEDVRRRIRWVGLDA